MVKHQRVSGPAKPSTVPNRQNLIKKIYLIKGSTPHKKKAKPTQNAGIAKLAYKRFKKTKKNLKEKFLYSIKIGFLNIRSMNNKLRGISKALK